MPLPRRLRPRAPLLAAALSLVALEAPALACAVCQSGAPAAAEPPARGALTLALSARAGSAAVSHFRVDERRLEALASYELTSRIGADLGMPLLFRTVESGGRTADVVSPGDLETRARFLARRWREGSLSFFAGAKWPTAPVGSDASGALLPSALQPGCSSIAPLLGSSALWLLDDWVIGGTLQILLPFSIRDAPHPGDSLRLAATAERELAPWLATRSALTLRLETGGALGEDRPDPDSGGAVLYVGTGAVLRPTRLLTTSIDISFPVAQGWFGRRRESPVVGATLAFHL